MLLYHKISSTRQSLFCAFTCIATEAWQNGTNHTVLPLTKEHGCPSDISHMCVLDVSCVCVCVCVCLSVCLSVCIEFAGTCLYSVPEVYYNY